MDDKPAWEFEPIDLQFVTIIVNNICKEGDQAPRTDW